MKAQTLLLIGLIVTSCSNPSPVQEDVFIPKGDLFIVSHEEDDESFFYRYKLTTESTKLLNTMNGSELQLTTPNSMDHSKDRNELYIANDDAVYIYHLTADGPRTNQINSFHHSEISEIKDIAYYENEIYVLTNNSIYSFDANSSGEVEALRIITGSLTELEDARAIKIHNNEIYIANQNEILIYQTSLEGNIAPVRKISSQGLNPNSIAINAEKEILYVANSENSILKFDLLADGDVLPLEMISGSKTLLNNPGKMVFDQINETIILCQENSLIAFPERISGNLPPSLFFQGIESPKAITLFKNL